MRLEPLVLFLLGWTLGWRVDALVTFQTIRELTDRTQEMRGRIRGVGLDLGDDGLAVLRGVEELVLGSGRRGGDGDGDGEEGGIEIIVTAALNTLCSEMVVELEKPLSGEIEDGSIECPIVTSEYHSFLEVTVKFLHEIQELQMLNRWRAVDGGVFDGLVWLQSLWASRKSNKQNRSFIEQQIGLYSSTDCFGKNVVLKRDVEVVEYINDLIDLFR